MLFSSDTTSVDKSAAVAGRRRTVLHPAAVDAQAVQDLLRRRIAAHDLAPGAPLRESAIATELGVPRSWVHDALAGLEVRGLVARDTARGLRVATLTHTEIDHLLEAREALESECVRLAVAKADPAVWRPLVDLFGRPAGDAVAAGDLDGYLALIDRLREETVARADNPVLAGIMDGLHDRTMMLMRRLVILPGRAVQGLAEHRTLLAAMVAGDATEAAACKRAQMQSARDWVRRFQALIT